MQLFSAHFNYLMPFYEESV